MSTPIFNLKHTFIVLRYQFRNYFDICDVRSKHLTLVVIDVHRMVLIIISITPGALGHDTNVRTGGKNHKDLDA